MKKILAIITVATITAMAGAALAADTNTLTVTANVTGTCKFVSNSSTLAFGALDPASFAEGSADTTTSYWCTTGTKSTILASNGVNYADSKRNMKETGTSGDLIPYELTLDQDVSLGAGPTNPQTLSIHGKVLFDDYKDKTAGDYSDTVVLSFEP